MKLNTSKKEYEVIVEEGDEKATFYGYPLTPKEVNDLLRKATTHPWDKNQRFEDFDLYKFKISKIRTVINRWVGIENENGDPIECNDKNKEIVYIFNPTIIDEALKQFDAIGASKEQEKEYREKNLSDGSNGTPGPEE
jgi:hypothetical protein